MLKIRFFVFGCLLVHKALSGCVPPAPACKPLGEGKDICTEGTKCVPSVIRPVPIPAVPPPDSSQPRVVCKVVNGGQDINLLKPEGDLCSCQQSIVIPAIVPKPPCLPNVLPPPGSLPPPSPHGPSPPTFDLPQGPTAAVIDPVSLSLALQQQKKVCGLSEAKLSYGFRKLPEHLPVKKPQRLNIDEYGFNVYNGDIVEMKKYPCASGLSVDEQALAELEADAAEEQDLEEPVYAPIKPIRFADIGFRVAKTPVLPFHEIEGAAGPNPPPCGPPPPPKVCPEGYAEGHLLVKNLPVKEKYVPLPKPCGCAKTLAAV